MERQPHDICKTQPSNTQLNGFHQHDDLRWQRQPRRADPQSTEHHFHGEWPHVLVHFFQEIVFGVEFAS